MWADPHAEGWRADLFRAREAVKLERDKVRALEAEVFVLRVQLATARAALERRYEALLP